MKPTVSVIMPVYNSAAYLGDAVGSILTQGYTDFELLICDDDSQDNSYALACDFARRDPRVRVVRNDRNLHIAATLNRLYQSVRGKYVAIMDADDISTPQRLAKQVAFLDSNSSIGVVGSWYALFGERCDGKVVKPFAEDSVIRPLFLFDFPLGHATTMLRHSLIRKHGLTYDTNFSHSCDYLFFVRASAHIRMASIPEVLYRYRQHAGRVSLRKQPEHARTFVQANMEVLEQWGIADPSRDAVAALCAYYFLPQSAVPAPPVNAVRDLVRRILQVADGHPHALGWTILKTRVLAKYLRFLTVVHSPYLPLAAVRFFADFGLSALLRVVWRRATTKRS